MKKKRKYGLFFCTLMLTASTTWGTGRSVTPYFEGFEEISFSSILPAGWSRIADNRPGYDNVAYSASSGQGVDGTKCLSAGSQTVWDDYGEDTVDVCDLIVTPAVKGTASFCIKGNSTSYYESPSLEVYSMTANSDGSFTKGDAIDISAQLADGISTTDWTVITLDLQESTALGLRLSKLYLDSFSATEAVIPEKRELKISNFKSEGSATYYCTPEGKVTFNLSCTLKNNGNVTLNPGDEGYSITVTSGEEELCVVPVGTSLEPGQETTLPITAEYRMPDPQKNQFGFSLKATEGISETSTTSQTLQLKGYIPELDIYLDNRSVSTLDFGLAKGTASATLELINKGSAPLTVTAINTPEGVTATASLPLTITAGEREAVTFTLGGNEGIAAGEITFDTNGTGSENKTKISYKGAVANPQGWVEEFTDGSEMPQGWIASAQGWSLNTVSGNTFLKSTTSESSVDKIITPRISVTGNGIYLGVAKTASGYYTKYSLKIWRSADRSNWELAKELQSSDFSGSLNEFSYIEVPCEKGDCYFAFEGLNAGIDNIFGGSPSTMAHDIYITSFTAPESGMVNYPVATEIALRNMGQDIEDRGTYRVDLLLGDKTVATLEGKDTKDLDNETTAPTVLKLGFTPHETAAATTLRAVVTMLDGGETFSTAVKDFSIAGETLVAEHTVGTIDPDNDCRHAVASSTYKNSIVDYKYPAQALGLGQGEKISAITFYYTQYADKNATRDIRIWLRNADAAEGERDFDKTDDMTQVYTGTLTTGKSANEIKGAYSPLSFTLTEPFEYNGGDLHVVVASNGDAWTSLSFAALDGSLRYKQSDNDITTASVSSDSKIPVATLGLVKEAPAVSGYLVSHDSNPLGNARVRMSAGEVWYETLSDESGFYSLDIMQPGKEYVLTAAASGHLDHTGEPVAITANTDFGQIKMAGNNVDASKVQYSTEGDNNVTVTWEPVTPGSADSEVRYAVRLDGGEPAITTECSHTFTSVPKGAHTVSVAAYFPDGDVTTAPAEVAFTTTGISQTTNGILRAYASDGSIHVECSEECSVRILTVSGQLAAAFSGAGATAVAPGVYIVTVNAGGMGYTYKLVVR